MWERWGKMGIGQKVKVGYIFLCTEICGVYQNIPRSPPKSLICPKTFAILPQRLFERIGLSIGHDPRNTLEKLNVRECWVCLHSKSTLQHLGQSQNSGNIMFLR